MDSAIHELEEKTASSIEKGLKDLGVAFKSLKAAMKDRKAAEADITHFAHAIENGFEHPWSFLYHVGKNILVNGKDIYAEVTSGVADWKAQSYRAAGVQVSHHH